MDRDTAAVSSYSLALYHAVDQGNVKLAEELLKADANVNHKNERGNPDEEEDAGVTPIIVAVKNSNLKMVKLLLEYNPNVNDPESNGGRLPLVEAAEIESLEIVRTLLAHPGIMAGARDSRGYWAFQAACEVTDYEILKLLVEHGQGYSKDQCSEALALATQIVWAADTAERTDVIRILLEHGADPNYVEPDSVYPPLYSFLLCSREWDAVRLLLRYGATTEIPFKLILLRNGGRALNWLAANKTRTIISFKGLVQQSIRQDFPQNRYTQVLDHWNAIVSSLWFHYFGPNQRHGDPPCVQDIAQLPDKDFKMAYKWMIHAVSTLLFLKQGNLLLTHLLNIFDPTVALEPCDHTGKTPLLTALEMFPQQDETKQQDAARGTNALIEWNPDALKIRHPESQRMPMTCAINSRATLATLQKMITCKKEHTTLPLQLDPYTLLPNFLLVAVGKDGYSEADIYAFSRNYLPGMISSWMSPTPGVGRRGIKRSSEQI